MVILCISMKLYYRRIEWGSLKKRVVDCYKMLKIYRDICNRVVRYNTSSLSSKILSSKCTPFCRRNKLLLSSSLSSLASSNVSSSSSSVSSSSSSSPTLSSKLNINILTTNDSNDNHDDDDEEDDDDQGKIDLTPKKMSVVHHPYSIEKSKPIGIIISLLSIISINTNIIVNRNR